MYFLYRDYSDPQNGNTNTADILYQSPKLELTGSSTWNQSWEFGSGIR